MSCAPSYGPSTGRFWQGPRSSRRTAWTSHGGEVSSRPWAAVSVPVSFSPVHGRSGEPLNRPHVDNKPPMNPGERPRTQPATTPPQLESVHFGARRTNRCAPGSPNAAGRAPCCVRARSPRLDARTRGGPTEGGGTVSEWKQGKCGWPTDRGSCRNKTTKGTSRCYRHQGDWTKRGQAEAKERASKRRKK